MYRTGTREIGMWVGFAIQQLTITILISLGIHLLFPKLSWGWSIILGTAAWTVIFCFVRGINLFTANVADFHGAVLSNRFRSYKRPEIGESPVKLGTTKMLEEIGPGIHPKWPWQTVTQVDLRRQITVEKTVDAYSSDRIELKATYIMVLKALRGYLCNLVRNTEGESQKILIGGTESRIVAKLNSIEQESAIRQIDDLKTWFGEIYGGDDNASPIERRCGLATSELTVKSITRSPKYQKAAEAEAISKQIAKSVKGLVESGTGTNQPITGKHALNAMLAIQEGVEYKVFDVMGLENLQNVGGVIPGDLLKDKKKGKGKEE